MGKTVKKMGGLKVPDERREANRRRQKSGKRDWFALDDREKGDARRTSGGPGQDDDPDEDRVRRG